jgi:maleate isomerase
MLRAREAIAPERFTFHSSRMRMRKVTADELAAMDAESDRCAIELSDARVDILGYACLVAIMAMGHGYHRVSQERLRKRTQENGADIGVVSSAGALVDSLHHIGARRIALVAPYMKPLTKLVVDYIEAEGITVSDHVALEIADNLDVGRHDPARLPEIVSRLDASGVDAIVLSACVQMPSLPAVPLVEARTGKPVVTAAIATTFQMLRALDLSTTVPGGGALLSGAY